MWYVYVLKSRKKSNWAYVGFTNDLKRRLVEHKSGKTLSTKGYLPLYLDAYIAMRNEYKARMLEEYLKGGSGKAFLKKRILTDEALAQSVPPPPL